MIRISMNGLDYVPAYGSGMGRNLDASISKYDAGYVASEKAVRQKYKQGEHDLMRKWGKKFNEPQPKNDKMYPINVMTCMSDNKSKINALKEYRWYLSSIIELKNQVASMQRSDPHQPPHDDYWRQNENNINALRDYGFDDIADQLTNLHQMVAAEGETIVPRSLQNFVLFVVRERNIPIPEIGLNPDGCIQTVWQAPSYGSLAMDFLDSGDVMFSILFYQHGLEAQKPRSGVSSVRDIMNHIGEFMNVLRGG